MFCQKAKYTMGIGKEQDWLALHEKLPCTKTQRAQKRIKRDGMHRELLAVEHRFWIPKRYVWREKFCYFKTVRMNVCSTCTAVPVPIQSESDLFSLSVHPTTPSLSCIRCVRRLDSWTWSKIYHTRTELMLSYNSSKVWLLQNTCYKCKI